MRYAVSTFLFFLVLAGCGKKRVEDAIALLGHPDRQVRQDGSYDLILLGGRAVEPLLARAATGSDSMRFISAQILGKIGDTRAIPLLRQFILSPNVHVRQEAVRALGQMGDTTLVEPLVQILQNDAGAAVRRTAAESLGNLRAAAAVAPLVRALAVGGAVDGEKGVIRNEFIALLGAPSGDTVGRQLTVDVDGGLKPHFLAGFHQLIQ